MYHPLPKTFKLSNWKSQIQKYHTDAAYSWDSHKKATHSCIWWPVPWAPLFSPVFLKKLAKCLKLYGDDDDDDGDLEEKGGMVSECLWEMFES